MTEYFDRLKGGTTIYYGSEGVSDVRLILMHFGEDPARVIDAFWQEKKGDFLVVPIVAYGAPPRRDLCSQTSLLGALQTVTIGTRRHGREAMARGLCVSQCDLAPAAARQGGVR